jgi:excisionase family DNA binding protein
MNGRVKKLRELQVEGLSPEESAYVAGLGRTTVFQQIAAGNLKARKVGKKTIVLRADLMAFLENLPRVGANAA